MTDARGAPQPVNHADCRPRRPSWTSVDLHCQNI